MPLISSVSSAGAGIWGSIGGTLADQTDLQSALDAHAPKSGYTSTGLLQFSGTDHAGIQLLSLTTTQKNALTPANGMLLYDSDLGLVNAYAGGAWASLAHLGANTFTALQTVSLGTNSPTPAEGILLSNATAAISGTQSSSPSLLLTGQGWKTDATADSQSVSFRQYVLPVQGSSAPTGKLVFESSVNGGSWQNGFSQSAFTIDSGGTVTIPHGQSYATANGHAFKDNGSNGVVIILGGGNMLQFSAGGTGGSGQTELYARDLFIGASYTTHVKLTTHATNELGIGAESSTPAAQTFGGARASGTNITGGPLTLAGGLGSGTGLCGDLIFAHHAAGSSGTTLGTLAAVATIKSDRLQVASAMKFQLGNTAQTETIIPDKTIRLFDAAGTEYKVACVAA